MALPSLSIVVPTYQRPHHVRPLIAALEELAPAPVEVLYVVREADGPTREALRDIHTPLPIREAYVTVPGNLPPVQLGCAEARGDVIAILDDDARPTSDWARRIIERFTKDARLGILAGRVREDFRALPEPPAGAGPRFGRVAWPGRPPLAFTAFEFDGGAFEVVGARGANMAIRRQVVPQLEFDLRLNVGSGRFYENDLCWQAREAGWRVLYDPTVVVDHFPDPAGHRDGKAAVAHHAFTVGHNWTLIALKHLDTPTRMAFVPHWFLWGSSTSPGPIRWLGQGIGGKRPPLRSLWEGMRGRSQALRTVFAGRTR
jgi:GT2 family glycosyltransferase